MIRRLDASKRTRKWVTYYCLIVTLLSGCCGPRSYYREQADNEVYGLIEEKTGGDTPIDHLSIAPNPLSRMFDPFNLDCPPMPPDDPASHTLMHGVDCRHGYECWHANGDTTQVENPDWWHQLVAEHTDADGVVRVDVDEAMRLALIHSPLYQRELEELYLSALDVSFQRFQFDSQYFSGYSGFFTSAGRRNRNASDSSTRVDIGTFSAPGSNALRKEKLYSDGTQLVVGLANALMWEFSGADMHSATTLLNFSLIQPLLRRGGRDVVLESLTQSERGLLANVRQMERFRRSFYVEIFAGRGSDQGPGVNGVSLFGLNGQTGTTGQAGGYLGILQSLQDIRNQRSNIASLQSSVAQLEAFFLAGRIDFFQVELARQALFSAQSRLLNAERALKAQLDSFKILLGLPPYLELEFDQSLIEPFQLVDPEIVPLQNRLTRLQQVVGETIGRLFARAQLPDLERTDPQEELPRPNADAPVENGDDFRGPADRQDRNELSNLDEPDGQGSFDREEEESPTELIARKLPSLTWDEDVEQELTNLRKQVREAIEAIRESRTKHLPVAKQDTETLQRSMRERTGSADRLRERIRERLEDEKELRGLDEITDEDVEGILPFNANRLNKLPIILNDTIADIGDQFDDLERLLNEADEELGEFLEKGKTYKPTQLYKRLQDSVRTALPDRLNILSATVLSLTLVQARARTETVTINGTDSTWQDALETARNQRLDWMNARASLVDTWRQIQFTANDLESQLDFVVEGDLGNVGDNPLDINLANSRLRFGLEFDAPLTRLQERNTYRQSQIEFQRARRAFYRFEDGVAFSLRDIIRRMEVNQIDFELQRAAVEVAISQVELARLRLQEPPRPNEQASFGATTARDLVQALAGLLNAQNDFLDVWVRQEVLRRLLDLDRGTMRLSPTGMWIDPSDELNLLDASSAVNGDATTPSAETELIPLPDAEPEMGLDAAPDASLADPDQAATRMKTSAERIWAALTDPPRPHRTPPPLQKVEFLQPSPTNQVGDSVQDAVQYHDVIPVIRWDRPLQRKN